MSARAGTKRIDFLRYHISDIRRGHIADVPRAKIADKKEVNKIIEDFGVSKNDG